jgi:hypothetical protein
MEREDVIRILNVLKTAFPNSYKDMTKVEAENTINLWLDMFQHENVQLVLAATKNLINTFKWPPTIADIKEEMYKITNRETETPVEVWNKIRKAIRNSAYNSYDEFQKLPDKAKRFVGSPNQLKEWAISENFIESVVKGQFLKQYEILEKRQKEEKMMLPEVKVLTMQIGQDINKLLN